MKCPMCGAPMENNKCGYCGYREQNDAKTHIEGNDTQQVKSVVEQNTINTTIIYNNNSNTDAQYGISRKSKWGALLLCVFLGYFGAHKFYVGKIGMGLLYLCTFGLFGFGWVIDMILIATGSFRDEFDLPLRM